MVYMFLFTFLGTFIATLIGSVLSLLSKKLPKIIFIFLQNFSIGAILAFLFIELFSHSFEHLNLYFNNDLYGSLLSLGIILISGVLFFLLHELIHKFSHHHKEDHNDEEPCEDHAHSIELFNKSNSLLITSFIYLGAIFVHNVPEGITLGLSFISDSKVPLEGIIFSIVLLIHNLIIGFSMCSSFLSSGKSTKFSILMTLISSLPALILGIISYFISTISINNLFVGVLISISAGSLLFVIFIELIPQTLNEYKSRYSFLFILLGIVIVSFLLLL